jgi:stage II sporulation protein D
MLKYKSVFVLSLLLFAAAGSAQVKIRVFAGSVPESVVFSVTSGTYTIDCFGETVPGITAGKPVIITKYNGKLAVKSGPQATIICDSVAINGKSGKDSFSLRLNGSQQGRRDYSGGFMCYPDLGTMVLINNVNEEDYVAGVVQAEGGSGRNPEYFKAQAVIARTYLYRYQNKHQSDRYNLCDDTHCQVFKGVVTDSLIRQATELTAGKVILSRDSTLIISAFHSNCGGETSSSEDVWISGQPYLKSVVDPYCLFSRNARWEKSISLSDWSAYLKNEGYKGSLTDPAVLNFAQTKRRVNYEVGSFSLPLTSLRAYFKLRSSFFSVTANGNSVILNGKGYGHGVGLCQEGAMVMATRGIKYQQIIEFYYTGVIIADIKNAVPVKDDTNPQIELLQEFEGNIGDELK